MADIQILSNLRCRLGEGPVWDAKEQALYLVDIEGRQIHRIGWDKGSIRSWTLPSMIGCMALRASAGAIVALQDGFHAFDFVTGRCEPIAGKLHGSSEIRFNDGKTDRQGRFYAATMDMSARRAIGNLYCLNTNLVCDIAERDVVIGNGTCVSPDGGTFYFCDTPQRVIWAYDHDGTTGKLGNRRVLVDTSDHGFLPDGCTVDAEGFLWSACPRAARIARYSPGGKLDRVIEMPTRYVSSVMFGGPELDVLFVTSICESHFGEPERDPLAGAVFAVHDLDVRGLPETRFAG